MQINEIESDESVTIGVPPDKQSRSDSLRELRELRRDLDFFFFFLSPRVIVYYIYTGFILSGVNTTFL